MFSRSQWTSPSSESFQVSSQYLSASCRRVDRSTNHRRPERRLPNMALQQTGLSVAALPLAPVAERRYVGRTGTSLSDVRLMVLDGRLCFLSETGDEGGRWGFQEARFIEENTTYFVCRKCSVPWDMKRSPQGPSVSERCFAWSTPQGDKLPELCPDKAHDFALFPAQLYSREGLHVLADGDELTVYDKQFPSTILWSGTISLRTYPVFTQNALGYWIHADQNHLPRETWARWFIDEYPGTLRPR
jgi:hypothetical protein